MLTPVAYGEKCWLSERLVQIAQCNPGQVRRNTPATGMPSVSGNEPCIAKQTHGAPDDHGVRAKAMCQRLGSHWRVALGHMQQCMKYGG